MQIKTLQPQKILDNHQSLSHGSHAITYPGLEAESPAQELGQHCLQPSITFSRLRNTFGRLNIESIEKVFTKKKKKKNKTKQKHTLMELAGPGT